MNLPHLNPKNVSSLIFEHSKYDRYSMVLEYSIEKFATGFLCTYYFNYQSNKL